MTCLIHLNGPPGIGKSTVSALYADRHPGTLNLDIDRLHGLIGGWQDSENHAHEVLRPVALAMAGVHLSGGRDVILPQYLARLDQITAFENIARQNAADFLEFILLDDKDESVARFHRRPDLTAWDQHNRHIVAAQGGTAFLASMYDSLIEVARLRCSAVVIRSQAGAIEETYAQLVEALSQARPQH